MADRKGGKILDPKDSDLRSDQTNTLRLQPLSSRPSFVLNNTSEHSAPFGFLAHIFSMAPFDFIAEQNVRDARLAFARSLIEMKEDIVAFVDKRLGWNGTGYYDGFLKGSFNISLVVQRADSEEHVIICFPVPGNIHEPWRDEKVENKVMVMRHLRDLTSIPVPLVRDWGLTENSPQHLGPFIIMDFVEGQDLSDLLQQPTENKEDAIVLDPDVNNAKLDFVYG
ncbi:phosphotransferase enzyme family protein [Colletotrichum tofieldiae]|uniref:Phosphotransferase enzyme family protein n=1 Tax=Colletotrichum tofieldiae TaxID=708197 RepID=A0A161VXI6_9PEZI|nr:phosphotransferase enzyme family protein [Colletotrichum tofieldiae]